MTIIDPSCIVMLIRIDRRLIQSLPYRMTVREYFTSPPEVRGERPPSQGERFCTALLLQVSESEDRPLGAQVAHLPDSGLAPIKGRI